MSVAQPDNGAQLHRLSGEYTARSVGSEGAKRRGTCGSGDAHPARSSARFRVEEPLIDRQDCPAIVMLRLFSGIFAWQQYHGN